MALLVPWVIDGAKHSARLFRREHQQMVGVGSGVSRPGDLKVSALAVPGAGFRVAAGGGTAQSRDTDSTERESYAPINDAQISVLDLPGTGSSGGRRDLVILEITDPEMSSVSYPAPVEPKGTGAWLDGATFNRITVIPGVGAGVTSLNQITTGAFANVTGITLAAINYPPSTATITNAMIEDLREVQLPREKTVVRAFGVGGTADKLTALGAYPAGGTTWPNQTMAETNFRIDIPEWATQASVIMTVAGVQMNNVTTLGGDAAGWFWVQLGLSADPSVVRTEPTRWDADAKAAQHRTVFRTADTITIPAGLRGTTQRFVPRANVTSETQAPGTTYSGPRADNPFIPFPIADSGSSVDLMVVFREVKE